MKKVNQNKLSLNQKTLLNIVSHSLFQSDLFIPDDVNWEALYNEACQQAVALLAFSSISKSLIPKEIKNRWKKTCDAILAHNMRVEYEHIELNDMLSHVPIPYVILKGCASACYYPVPILRSMGDVDFLVGAADLKDAGSVLEKNGFQSWQEEHICHVVYKRDNTHFEMHFEPSGVPSGRVGEIVRDYLNDIMETANPYTINGGEIWLPDPFHHGLILLLHTSHHLTGEGIGLRHLCDWAVFVNSLSDHQFRDLFEEKLKAIGLWRFAMVLTQLCIRYLGCPKKILETETIDDDLLEEMMCDIFAGGNFGQKDKERSNEAYLISSRGKHGVGHNSMLHQFMVSMNEAVYTHMPSTKKNKILLPVGWMFVGGRQIWYMIAGKRKKMHLRKMILGAGKRKEIYKQLQLFER